MACISRLFSACFDNTEDADDSEEWITTNGKEKNLQTSGEEDQPLMPQEVGYMGRLWNWFKPYQPNILRGAFGIATLTSLVTVTFFSAKEFQQNEEFPRHSMLYGTGLGILTTILTGCVLPIQIATALADWWARWSFEGLEILTQFYLNAGCPIDGNGFWDTDKVPPAIKELSIIIFSGVSANVALLALRTLLFSKNDSSDDQTPINEIDIDGYNIYQQDPDPIKILESGSEENKIFTVEQLLKLAIGGTLIGLASTGVVTIPQLLYLGFYLTGHSGGAILGKVYLIIKSKIYEKCLMQKNVIDAVDKIGRIITVASLGIFFAWPTSPSFFVLGGLSGVTKMLELRKFELLEKNDEQFTPFEFMRVDNIAKGALLGLMLTWYISGLTDSGLAPQDYANIITYLVTIAISYPATRYLVTAFEPRENNRLFNTLRFYFVNHSQVLVLPYMIIRAAQSVGNNVKNPQLVTIIENLIAWASLGIASGNNRALLGGRSERSPNEVSGLAELVAWYILGSRGHFR